MRKMSDSALSGLDTIGLRIFVVSSNLKWTFAEK